jgi:hypothetical protein
MVSLSNHERLDRQAILLTNPTLSSPRALRVRAPRA